MGIPWDLKTDNGPAYKSQTLQEFLKIYNITHHTGIPYNPQGQAIIEHTNYHLKQLIKKEKQLHPQGTPDEILTSVLITLNLLTFDEHGLTPIHRHWGTLLPRHTLLPLVRWHDPLTNLWKGPSSLLTQGRGFACVFPEDVPQPQWIPARNIRPAFNDSTINTDPTDDP